MTKIILKGGPLHNEVKEIQPRHNGVNSILLPVQYFDIEIVRPFTHANAVEEVSSRADMYHTYIPTDFSDDLGQHVYFYKATEVTDRMLNANPKKADAKREDQDDPSETDQTEQMVVD